MMIRTCLLASAVAFGCAPAALADHNHYGTYSAQPSVASIACEKQRDSDRLAGGVVGAVAGGLIGAAIGGALEPDNGYHRYRGYRGYRGYHRYRGYRRHHRGYYHDRGDDGAEIAGAVIGGVLGAAIGSEVAADSTNCYRTYSYGIAKRSYGHGDPYAPTRSPTGPAWENPDLQQSARRADPLPASSPAYPSVPAYPSEPAYPTPDQDELLGAPEESRTQGDCTTVRRETRLPDGTVIREPVEVCQTADGRWQMPREVPEF
ncbi:MAG: hypothetical protein AAGL90_16240 [Pseudomonadota bacterium]